MRDIYDSLKPFLFIFKKWLFYINKSIKTQFSYLLYPDYFFWKKKCDSKYLLNMRFTDEQNKTMF